MVITAAVYFVLLVLSIAGATLLKENRLGQMTKDRAMQFKKHLDDGFNPLMGKDNILMGTGIFMTRSHYQLFRFMVLSTGVLGGLIAENQQIVMVFIILFIAASPRTKVSHLDTPFGFALKALKTQYGYKKDNEIFEAMAFLKNSIAMTRNNPIGADLMIEQLAGYGDLLKPIYFRMLNLLRLNRKEEAIDFFAREAGTSVSRDFGRLLIQLDEISPRELEETLLSYQKNMREVKITRQKQQDEIMSDCLYLPVVINVLLIFINFIYVSYFIEQKDMFGILIS